MTAEQEEKGERVLARAGSYFKRFSHIDTVYVTSNERFFASRKVADLYAIYLEDKSVAIISREQVEYLADIKN